MKKAYYAVTRSPRWDTPAGTLLAWVIAAAGFVAGIAVLGYAASALDWLL